MAAPPHLALLAGLVVATTLGAAAATASADGAVAPSHAAAAAPRPLPTLSTRGSRYGRILTDGRGRTLYLFTRDGRGPSRCYGACARAWPPLLVRGTPTTAGGARAKAGTTTRRTGSRQVTYDGKPVYYFAGESRAGQIFCQDAFEFGGTWLVVAPAGAAIR